MQYSSLVRRISGRSTEVWEIHYEAQKRLEHGEDIIILSVGEESDKTTPDEIQETAIASIRGGRHHYTDRIYCGKAGAGCFTNPGSGPSQAKQVQKVLWIFFLPLAPISKLCQRKIF